MQMVQLAARTRALEQENANLQFMLGLRDSEIGRLRSSLASPARGAGVAEGTPVGDTDAVATSPTEPAALTGSALSHAATTSSGPTRARHPVGGKNNSGSAGSTGGQQQQRRPLSPHDLIDGVPAPPSMVGAAASGVVLGIDGQWLRLRLNPSSPQ